MKVSALHPPNHRLLSADVIPGIVQMRSEVSRNAYVGTHERTLTMSQPPQPPRAQTSYENSGKIGHPGTTETVTGLSSIQTFSSTSSVSQDGLVMHKCPPRDPSDERDRQMTTAVEVIIADKVRLRELRRVRQIRYRQKKENHAASLDDGNKKLRSEIEQLSQRRRAAAATISTTTSGWSVAVEYFRLFQYGGRRSSATEHSIQMAFLQETMAPDILFNLKYGVSAILDYWNRIAQWFPGFEVELKTLEKASSNRLVARTITTLTISEETVRQVFPHLFRKDPLSGLSQLAQQLVGGTLVMQGAAQFEWDSEQRRVMSIHSHSGMLLPLLCLLGDLEKVSRVLSKALVTPDFHCKVMDGLAPLNQFER